MWLGWNIVLWTKRSRVRFLVLAGSVPGWDTYRRQASLWFILSSFLCKMWGLGRGSFSYLRMSNCFNTFCSLNCFCSFVKNQLFVLVWVYFCVLYFSIDLCGSDLPLPHSIDYCRYVVVLNFQENNSSHSLPVKIVLVILGTVSSCINFRISLCLLKNLLGVW